MERKKMGGHRASIETPRSILILKPSSFGDIVHTLPAAARLKEAWPDCRVSWLVNREWTPLLEGNPNLAEVVPFPRREFRGAAGWYRFVKWCRDEMVARRPDMTLDFQGLLRTALVGRASRPGIFCGMSDAREGARWFYDRVAPIPAWPMHAVDRYLMLAHDVLGTAFPQTQPEFSLPDGEPVKFRAGNLPRDFVLLHPYARGDGKSLSDLQIEAICQRLAPRQVVLIGRKESGPVALPPSVVDLVNETSLRQLIWIVRRSACVVSVDSGPSHLAAALGRPLVAIHTWSDPRRVGPYRDDAWVWKNARLLQMKRVREQDEAFFQRPPTPLRASDIDAVCDLAISLSDSCA